MLREFLISVKENTKLGIAIVSAGLIGGLCWKFRRKIMKGLMADYPRVYVEYELPNYTWVKGDLIAMEKLAMLGLIIG